MINFHNDMQFMIDVNLHIFNKMCPVHSIYAIGEPLTLLILASYE